jgi:two-component system phosphate regulon sensor histidine kinase PhoR
MEYPHLPPDESRRMLQAMQRHSERLNALVEDLLTLTRLETKPAQVEFSTVRLDALLRRIVQDWQQQMNSGHAEIQVNIPGELPAVELDPLRFEQVILNLLENAVAYSNPPRSIQLSAVLYGDLIEIRVDDNGIGIPLGDLPHIFERFYRVDKGRSRVSGGTGLGLSIVKHIMQIHRGTVHAESEMGKGTTVVLRMPLAQEELR